MRDDFDLVIVGGGLAGSEAAWQAAQRGVRVRLYEMRPSIPSGAHISGELAELVCSNSLGSDLPDRAAGVLKAELRRLGSLLMRCADATVTPAGGALAVDRAAFARQVTQAIENHPNIRVVREEAREIPGAPTVLASGPLTSPRLAQAIQAFAGADNLYFYDAIAPILTAESINMEIAYRGSRYSRGEDLAGDYINCPLTREDYETFVEALVNAERIQLHDFERDIERGVKAGMDQYFEGCLPIEILAERDRRALLFGPMRPVGLFDKRTDRRHYAVLQLRQDNLAATLYNLVGFQTNLKFGEQRRVLRMIPGLEAAEFARYGQMHRNTFIYSPGLIYETLQCKRRDDLFFAGQITGVEGYVGNIATGLLAGWNAARWLRGEALLRLPATTMIGALCTYVSHAVERDFQPMKANFGILAALEGEEGKIRGKRPRAAAFARRSGRELEEFLLLNDTAGIE
ncbi:MAG: methylenetetrahydrofolate--tRNA-(uracil(54)-C(5))-methyltransferase (FADH(2)-oxidizing) TrmFO [Chloroflexi bacterium]|nr:methylenetetrahydrofolate--tRNA-(uracil(54)-C(5))-methyltransferase (FADH(2)-oxidizing) TrmFO [Chloroflexota bacterium]